MLGSGRKRQGRARQAPALAAVRLVVSFALGCGGLAEGVAPGAQQDQEDVEPHTPALVPPASGPARLGGTSGSTTPSAAPSIAPDAVQTFCYAPAALEQTPALEEILPFLPEEAFDSAGCLAGEYSGWLLPGRCVYDPSGAELQGGRCCYRMDSATPDCDDPR